MGRKHVTLVAVAVVAIGVSLWAGFGTAQAQPKTAKLDKVTLQLKWVTQSQFAGYYAAKALGYYKKFGLDVNFKLGGPSITPETVVASGQADIGIDWLPSLREHRTDVRALGHDRAHLEGQRHHVDRRDEEQDRRRVVLRQPVRAVCRAHEVRDGS
jgi:hypothetical protein